VTYRENALPEVLEVPRGTRVAFRDLDGKLREGTIRHIDEHGVAAVGYRQADEHGIARFHVADNLKPDLHGAPESGCWRHIDFRPSEQAKTLGHKPEILHEIDVTEAARWVPERESLVAPPSDPEKRVVTVDDVVKAAKKPPRSRR
jgi:hypothetical protein